MADALVSVLLRELASITRQQAEQKVKLVVGVKKEVRKLTSNLRTIQAVLEDAERRQVKDATVKQWLAKLKDVSYDMDDVLDEWNTALLKKQIEGDENALQPKGKVCSFIPSFCFYYRPLAQRHDIAKKIKELNERLNDIADEKQKFNFTLTRGDEELEPQKTVSIVDVSEVYGRDEDKNTLVNMLLSESSQGPSLRIISIVGMGGIGKTTLAQLVYNDDTVKVHFQKRIWVCVSCPFDEVRIAKAIFVALKDKDPDSNELEYLFQHIHQSMEGKKFFLVLDDVWTEDYSRLEQLKNSLKCGSPGSRILVTTRKETVAKIIGTTYIFQLGQLSNEECWSLISQVAFFGRSNEECKNFEDIGRGIANKCKGLPLAAKVLGSLLHFKNTTEEWQSVLDSEVWELEEAEKDLFPPLLLSYYDLTSTMRQCFSYCAIFPKDYKMEKDRLIKLWMAQGYLKATRNKDMEMVGEECVKNLTMRSFFQVEEDEYDGMIRCKMHDIVHDFAQFLTKNECFVMEVNGSEESRLEFSQVEARHLRLMFAGGVSIPTSIEKVKKLRSLIVDHNSLNLFNSCTWAVQPKVFDQLTCLRTLDLSGSDFFTFRVSLTGLPKEVGKLIHLRDLNLASNIELKELPETMCGLCNLQSLNISSCGLEKLPHGLGNLINLRYLKISRMSLSFMPKGVERLTCLCTLDTFYVSSSVNDSEASSLKDLENLNHLRGILEISGLGKVRDADEIKNAQLNNKGHLLGLTLNFLGEEVEERVINDEKLFEVIQPPPNIEQLTIVFYKGTNLLLNWMMSLINLKKVKISECPNCELLSPLGKLSSLESLYIDEMASVKKVGIEFLGIEREVNKNDKNEGPSKKKDVPTSSSMIAFPKLEELTFFYMDEWEEWDYGMSGKMGEEEDDIATATTNIIIMPRLRSLTIHECTKLKALPDHLLHTTSLKTLIIRASPILEERYYKEKKGEDWPKLSHIPNIIIGLTPVQIDGQPQLYEESSSDSKQPDCIVPAEQLRYLSFEDTFGN